jgi:hypothetical protein
MRLRILPISRLGNLRYLNAAGDLGDLRSPPGNADLPGLEGRRPLAQNSSPLAARAAACGRHFAALPTGWLSLPSELLRPLINQFFVKNSSGDLVTRLASRHLKSDIYFDHTSSVVSGGRGARPHLYRGSEPFAHERKARTSLASPLAFATKSANELNR